MAAGSGVFACHHQAGFLLQNRNGPSARKFGNKDGAMTWSILARDEQGHFGVAIASRFFAVGALCVHTRRGVGALSTQALMNPLYGPEGIAQLAAGRPAQEVVNSLTGADEGRAQRQLHVLPATGAPAAHTGSACVDWCGHLLFPDFSVAGNMLAGAAVIESTAQAFQDARGRPLAERLLAAMAAGEAAGGDKRGKQAAALRIHGDEDYPQLDIRVDDHQEPIAELHRLYDKSLERYQPFMACLPGRHDATGLTDRTEIEERIARFHEQRRSAG
jgi:uncharacterized Ntn-hydrolase superfamily protein